MAKVIHHPELNAEAEVQEESVPGWLDLGWILKDDENVQPYDEYVSDDPNAVPEEK